MSKSPSLRRIQADIRELAIDPSDRYHAAPLENDMFEWHFTIRGANGTEFEGGIYHGRILLPAEYPFKPPNIMFLTPSGRFETGTKVCLSFSAFHPELWQPAWGIRLILEALISFLPTKGDGAIGALDWTVDERKRLAKQSNNFCCSQCGNIKDIMTAVDKRVKRATSSDKKVVTKRCKFQSEIEQLHALQTTAEDERKKISAENDSSNTKEPEDSVSKTKNNLEKEELSLEESDLGNEADAINDVDDSSKVSAVTKYPKDGTIVNDNSPRVSVPPTGEVAEEPSITVIAEGEIDTTTDSSEIGSLPPVEQTLLESPWFSDPILNFGIVAFSFLILMLVKKVQAIMDDMIALEAQLHHTYD